MSRNLRLALRSVASIVATATSIAASGCHSSHTATTGGGGSGGAGGSADAGPQDGGGGAPTGDGHPADASIGSDAGDSGGSDATDGGAGACGAETDWEPNNTLAQACPLPLGTAIDTTIGGTADSDDYFSFAADKSKVYTINVWNTTPSATGIMIDARFLGSGGLSLPLFGPTAIGPVSAPSNAGYWDLPAPTQAGTVIVHVQASAGATYRLAALPGTRDGLAHSATTFEPNNTPNTAAPINLGMVADTQLAAQDYYDYLQFPVAMGKTYAFGLTIPTAACLTFTGTLIADTGETAPLFASVNKGPTCVYAGGFSGIATNYGELTATSTGLGIVGLSATGTASYQLVVYPTNPDLVHDASYEPNNTVHTAATLALGTPVSSTVDASADYYDYFQVPVDAGATYAVAAASTAVSGYFQIAGLSPDGNTTVITAANVGNPLGIPSVSRTYAPTTAGTLLILVSASMGTSSYTLGVTRQ